MPLAIVLLMVVAYAWTSWQLARAARTPERPDTVIRLARQRSGRPVPDHVRRPAPPPHAA